MTSTGRLRVDVDLEDLWLILQGFGHDKPAPEEYEAFKRIIKERTAVQDAEVCRRER